MYRIILPAVAIASLMLGVDQATGDDKEAQMVFFENQIRPLLSKNCYSCHGPQKQKSSLRLDSRLAMVEGGDSGSVLEPGHPEESLLVEVLLREEDQMPPGKRLTGKEIAAIRKWIQLGAPWPKSETRLPGSAFSADDRNYWAFSPLSSIKPQRDTEDTWSRNEIDWFVWKNFKNQGREPQAAVQKSVLLRRVFFDLIGLPPTPAEQDRFLNDSSPDAYAKLVNRLLDDPRYGEKWSRHWLDLVRFAESDGYKQDDFRPNAWRYRDYVIRSFNQDKPYDQFVLEQLAGDELDPDNPEYRVATGFLRHWIYEYNQRDVRTQWDTILNDVTSVTGDVFLGLSMNCARCHDHKFDPVLQKDFFRLKAFFAPLYPRDDLPVATAEEMAKYRQAKNRWLQATSSVRDEIDQLEFAHHQKKMNPEIDKFPLDIRPMMRKAPSLRSPFEEQLAAMAFRQVKKLTGKEISGKLKGKELKRWQELNEKLKEFDPLKPTELPMAMTVTDIGKQPPPTTIPEDKSGNAIEPGALSILDSKPMAIRPPMKGLSTGRRLALAQWIIDPQNPLTSRVIVNRIWHYHFGQGIVRSTSDFGRLGKPPADRGLLDYLAQRFISGGWRFKQLHRDILLSSTYRQEAQTGGGEPLRCFTPMVRRLDAEQIRDAMLVVSGELDDKRNGPSVNSAGKSRTIFTRVVRNTRDALLDAFDAPDNFNSTSVRNVTTTPTQSLLMINGQWTLSRARAMARKFDGEIIAKNVAKSKDKESHPVGAFVVTNRNQKKMTDFLEDLFRRSYCRKPSSSELQESMQYLGFLDGAKTVDAAKLTDFCHALLNSNEFIYLD